MEVDVGWWGGRSVGCGVARSSGEGCRRVMRSGLLVWGGRGMRGGRITGLNKRAVGYNVHAA